MRGFGISDLLRFCDNRAETQQLIKLLATSQGLYDGIAFPGSALMLMLMLTLLPK